MKGHEEKRHHPRMKVEYEYFATVSGHRYSGYCRDISPYGLCLLSKEELTHGKHVDLKLHIRDLSLSIELKGVVRHCTKDKNDDFGRDYLVGVELVEGTLEDFSRSGDERKTGHYAPSHTLILNADAKRCYHLLADYEKYPEWASGVDEAKILRKYPDGRGKRVEFVHNFFFRKVKYVLDYFYDDENCILSWESAGGDEEILKITGNYSFMPTGEDKCYATYTLDITLSIIPSRRLVQHITTVVMRKEMKNFKNFAEAHAKVN